MRIVDGGFRISDFGMWGVEYGAARLQGEECQFVAELLIA
jgi:hypothetical protein